MTKNLSKIIPLVLAALSFVPLFSIQVVPEWNVLLVNENGDAMPDVKVDQVWKDYSLEFWRLSEHVDHGNQSASDGSLSLPTRTIRVSAIQYLLATFRDFLAGFNPHSGFGSHSYILCRGKTNCHATFSYDSERPTKVVVKR